MFSRKERAFLTLPVRGARDGEGPHRELRKVFPPTYRRTLVRGIRRTAPGAAADWELDARAALVESKVLPGSSPPESALPAADPLAALLRSARAQPSLRRARPVRVPGTDARTPEEEPR